MKSNTGARENRDSPSTPPSSNPAYKIEATDEQDGMQIIIYLFRIFLNKFLFKLFDLFFYYLEKIYLIRNQLN